MSHLRQRTTRSRRRTPLLGGLALAVVLALVLGAYVYDHSRREMIAPGVRIGGLDVGGLRAPAARSRLRDELRRTRSNWITVRYRARRFTLAGSQARLRADVDGAVRRAVSVSRGGWLVSRTIRDLLGGQIHSDITLPASYSAGAVDQLVARIRSAINRPARDASATVDGNARLIEIRSQVGAEVDVPALRAALTPALAAPTTRHALSVPVRIIKPKVTTAMLAAEYPAYLVVDRRDFKLLLYQHLHLTHAYPIAVGQAGLQTPAGLHHILDKEVNPAWHVPNSSWAGSLAGQVIPPGPQDPLVARWMAIDAQGDGIHGTNEPWSIGSAASHGCIRMLVPDVIQLYRLTPLGSPVYVI